MSKVILVIDDTPDLLESICEFLAMEDFTVIPAANGLEGLRQLQSTKVDLIVTDLLMPVMDGFALIEQVKQDAALRTIPLIVFSAKPPAEVKEFMVAFGVDRFILKPGSLEHLLESINELLQP